MNATSSQFFLCLPVSVRLAVALLWVAVFVGCGSSGGGNDPSDTGVIPDVTVDGSDAPDADPDYRLCTDNLDCLGGEVCRQGLCRQTCGEDADCSAPTPYCNTGGLCAVCALDRHCGNAEVCEADRCVFRCETADDCGTDQACGSDGQCLDADCSRDADCPGGFRCRERLCLPIDPVVCTANASRCEGNNLVRCSADGTRETRETCTDLCVTRESGSRCASQVCEPDAVGCVDDVTAFLCSGDGTTIEELGCGADRYCDNGECRTQVCTPNSTVCEGDNVVTCDATGSGQAVAACASQEDCATSAAGCRCTDGACVVRVCRPGASRCVGTASQQCLPDGSGFAAPVTCDAEEICTGGRCVSATCEPGATSCAGETVLTCGADGRTRTATDCAASGNLCVETGGVARCDLPICTPGAITCTADGSGRATCDARGGAETETPCPTGQRCRDGACAALVCTPGEPPFCQAGDVFACNEDGSATVRRERCGTGLTCRAGVCEPQVCLPNSVACRGRVVERCAADGLSVSTTNCAATGQVCDPVAGACAAQTCLDLAGSYGPSEVCGDGLDNDNDARVDEGCACVLGSVQRCFDGPPAARGRGSCSDGWQVCVNPAAPRWSICGGAFVPGTETCNGADDDCNGCVDDTLTECGAPSLLCPSRDVGRVGRRYPLDGDLLLPAGATALSWTWTLTRPTGSLSGSDSNPQSVTSTNFLTDIAGNYRIRATAFLATGETASCVWPVEVRPAGLELQLYNPDLSVDTDVHLLRRVEPLPVMCGTNDCYYANCTRTTPLVWGYSTTPAADCEPGSTGSASVCPNPRLVRDAIRNNYAEMIRLDNPVNGDRFRALAHVFTASTTGTATPQFRLWCGATLAAAVGVESDIVRLTPATSGSGCANGPSWRAMDITTRVNSTTGALTCETSIPLVGGAFDLRTGDTSF